MSTCRMERRFWQPGRPTLWAGLTGLLVLISLLMVVAKRWNAASCAPQEGETKQVGYSNRLIHESSPYLLMHAHNPVDWYPWGEEALTKAKKEDKPIFLSIGYSTCHWCHVMEEKVFSDPKIAELMNEHFVSIKVDREERPDIDEIYMTTVQLMTGGGGWPLSAFLTPQGKAFFGGTYFPPDQFVSLCRSAAEAWGSRRQEVEDSANQIMAAVKQYSSAGKKSDKVDATVVDAALSRLRTRYDSRNGGFGDAPKFPPDMGLQLLLYEYERSRDEKLLAMVTGTLDAMAMGGIYDQIGGGFHRYSVDARWQVPHFEKMLYSQALLMRVYAEAYRLTRKAFYRRVVEDIATFVDREMTDHERGFYSALDADSPAHPGGKGEEGTFYVWSPAAVLQVLGEEDGKRVNEIYAITSSGDFEGMNVPHLSKPLDEWAQHLNVKPEAFNRQLDQWRSKLLRAREKRPRPLTDDKIISGWNGLMIGSLARAAQVLDAPQLQERAERAGAFLREKMWKQDRLLHVYRKGKAKLGAYADDYAYLLSGLLDLYETTRNEDWLKWAASLAQTLLDEFWDEKGEGFFYTSNQQTETLLRTKNPYDGALPSANSVAAQGLLRLYRLTGKQTYLDHAVRTLQAFPDQAKQSPGGFENLILATSWYLHEHRSASSGIEVRGAKSTSSASRVSTRLEPARITVTPGATVKVSLVLEIAPGWHVNSHKPSQEFLIPTAVQPPRDSSGVRITEAAYPKGKKRKFQFSKEELSVYERRVTIPLKLALAKSAPLPRTVKLQVRVQACNDSTCLAPATLEVFLKLDA
ncbi:MAG: DUF255 domain-containing protein [Armatimonadetes bacterium]|nr:DUF255 domain-containing protein [Armatimonadota bacterium]PIX42848.1 MAG: hypothetical protein COZ56_08385 [Armatimonadetes bacterium CG_4_8_14_3_um_filter_58_9]